MINYLMIKSRNGCPADKRQPFVCARAHGRIGALINLKAN